MNNQNKLMNNQSKLILNLNDIDTIDQRMTTHTMKKQSYDGVFWGLEYSKYR